MVNASNESISFGGSGLNGGIRSYITRNPTERAYHTTNRSENNAADYVKLRKTRQAEGSEVLITRKADRKQQQGEFCISNASFGYFYHACGMRNQCKSGECTIHTCNLYASLIKYAVDHHPEVEALVLPLLSVGAFATELEGGLKKAVFCNAITRAAIQGVLAGVNHIQYKKSDLILYLNNWKANPYKNCPNITKHLPYPLH